MFCFVCFRKQVLEWTSTRLLWSPSSDILQIYDRIIGEWRWLPFEGLEEGMDKAYKLLAERQKRIPGGE